MLTSVDLTGHPAYGREAEPLENLRRVNFFFGTNASGKSSLAQVMKDETRFPGCKVTWGSTPLQPLVYDREFFTRNFHELKGVFTLGSAQADAHEKLAIKNVEREKLKEKIDAWRASRDGKDGDAGYRGRLTQAEERFTEACWNERSAHDSLKEAISPHWGRRDRFRDNILQEMEVNTANLMSRSDLDSKAVKLFTTSLESKPPLKRVATNELAALDGTLLLEQPIVGKGDVDLSKLIEALSNSDWVSRGRGYLSESEGLCPFCQQRVTEDLEQKLERYFDQSFEQQLRELEAFSESYQAATSKVVSQFGSIVVAPPEELDGDRFGAKTENLRRIIAENLELIRSKLAEPSRRVTGLEDITQHVEELNAIIDSTNAEIAAHNRLVQHAGQEKAQLKREVWRYLVDRLKPALNAYQQDRSSAEKAIASLDEKITVGMAELNQLNAGIQELERKSTSIQPTVIAINEILQAFGFETFSVAISEDKAHYNLVRKDGSDAKATLSEGEKTFIAFLYFFHLLRGSHTTSGITTERVVIFDDPVTSLDANILFVVASLIKSVINEARSGTGNIRQVCVLTHNVYFHKEVTYKEEKGHTAFFTVQRDKGRSTIKQHANNPVRSSYQLLWDELKSTEPCLDTTPNIMRRILENYFKILGDLPLEEIPDKFEGLSKLICRSLIAWIHDGSHSIYDDLYLPSPVGTVESYSVVFRGIFEATNQLPHYKMMMGEDAGAEEIGGEVVTGTIRVDHLTSVAKHQEESAEAE